MEINALHQNSGSASARSGQDLPDVSTAKKTANSGMLTQVGMRQIEMPILFVVGAAPLLLPAKVDAFVSLDDSEAKGIHMSRLYLELKSNLQMKPVSAQTLKEVLQKFLTTHKGLSLSAEIEIRFQVPVERKALLSGERGFRQYPAYFKARLSTPAKVGSPDGVFDFVMGTEILYSSTCPCSAALAQQLQQMAFAEKFESETTLSKSVVLEWLGREEALGGTPHAQRSLGRVLVRSNHAQMGFVEFVDRLEKAVGTPVQAAVKRMDEQEFARLNAQNLMFCEDAARKIKGALEEEVRIEDFYIHVEHQESLHPHDAVSRVVKGVLGGFTAMAVPSLLS